MGTSAALLFVCKYAAFFFNSFCGLFGSPVRIPGIDIHGAPFSSLLCYAVSMVPNLYYVCKYAGMRLNLADILLRPGLATAVMAGVVLLLEKLLGTARVSHSLTLLLVVILAAMLAYFAAALLIGAIRRDDLPGRLKKLARR